MSAGVKEAFVSIIKEKRQTDNAGAKAIFEQIMVGRYATDVFE